MIDAIVSVVLVGILLTISVVGVNEYIDYAHFMENNEGARALFVATQSALTHYKASGQLTGLHAAFGGTGMRKVPDTATGGAYKGRLTYVIVDQGVPVGGNATAAFLDMLDDYIYDKEMLSGTYCVEFDPVDGLVYAAMYSKQAASLTYENVGSSAAGAICIQKATRAYNVRRPLLLGFYGTELSDPAPVSYGKPVFNYVALQNGDTLDLTWQLSAKYKINTQQLNYTVNLYDQNNAMRMTLLVNAGGEGRTLLAGASASDLRVIECPYTAYAADGTATGTGALSLLAYVTSESEVHVVLDALDVAAAETSTPAQIASSLSGLRLANLAQMAPTDVVYVRLQATGTNYVASAWKQTTTESLLMGSASSPADKAYTLHSARHLYNLRYLEALDGAAGLTFRQTDSFAWGGDRGILAAKDVFDTTGVSGDYTRTKVFTDVNGTAFPALPVQAGTLTADPLEELSIQKIYLHSASAAADPDGFGLFRRNTGTIENITLSGVRVSAMSTDNVGAFCGKNTGALSSLTVEGTVAGRDYTGGVVGYHEGASTITLSYLNNYAYVTGRHYVGGVTSVVRSNMTLSSCSNHRTVLADSSAGSYIGGITGHLNRGRLVNCTSAPQSDALSLEETISGTLLRGEYVGGIAGYNTYGRLENCSVGEGFVLGGRYVGGFTGWNELGASGEFDGNAGGSGRSVNRAAVAGREYVGGITSVCPAGGTVLNWLNAGLVAARTEFGGGVVGDNAGTIDNCGTSMDTAATSGKTLLAYAEKLSRGEGQYIGGVAGRNRGRITAATKQNVVAVVAGEACVGGAIGLNDASAGRIDNLGVSGAYVSGQIAVGGMIGANNAASLFEENYAVVPNIVLGDYFVGGVIGSNIVSAPAKNLTVRCRTNNFTGSLNAEAFAGGYIGFNAMLDAGRTETTAYRKALYDAVKDADTVQEAVVGVFAAVRPAASAWRMTVGDPSSTGTSIARMSSITAKLYVGGVLGYNDADTALTVYRVHNMSSVTATLALQDAADPTEYYSYAGGVIGIVTENTVIDGCENDDLAAINHKGSYLGGLTERNMGTIENCTTGSLRGSGKTGVGGIAGVNESLITDCVQSGTVAGTSNVGGITSISRGAGMIRNCTATGTVSGSGEHIGGIVGKNLADVEDCAFGGRVTGTGVYVGGFVGTNDGSLLRCTMPAGVSGISVTGKRCVGGCIGQQMENESASLDISDLISYAAVRATEGQAGGIAGYIADVRLTVENCENRGSVRADNGNAGGITAFNSVRGTIVNCLNTGDVYAPRAVDNGSIVAVNHGTISGCETHGTASAFIVVTGLTNIGGVAGYNDGTIRDTAAYNLSVYSTSASTAGANVGGIVGVNDGEGRIIRCGTASGSITVSAATTGGTVGGVAGKNMKDAVISGGSGSGTTSVDAAVTLAAGQTGAVGGIAGLNLGGVDRYVFRGSVSAPGDEVFGVGGIVGVNGSESGADAATVAHCSVDDAGTLTMLRSKNNALTHTESSRYTIETTTKGDVCVGGIVGRNNRNAAVSDSTLVRCYMHALYRFVGGVAGYNNGTVTDCNASGAGSAIPAAKPDLNVKLYMYQGHVGGLVGFNDQYGELTDSSTGFDWFVLVMALDSKNNIEATDDTSGGAIGRNISDFDVANIVNCADVTKDLNNNSGGKSGSAAGIMGRSENTTSSAWKIVNCKNYGDIRTHQRVGGMIGQWKYMGGTIENCENYGYLSAPGNANATNVGGMVGYCYANSKNQSLFFTGCRNFGTIQSNSAAGGILGTCNTGSGAINLFFTDCDNVGRITGTANTCGGIVGGNSTSSNYRYKILRCVDYYRFASDTAGAIAGSSVSPGTLVNCVDAVDAKKHVNGSNSYAAANFYLMVPTGAPSRGNIVTPAAVSATAQTDKNPAAYAADNSDSTYWTATNAANNVPVTLTFRLPADTDYTINSASVRWKTSGGYAYTYSFYRYADAAAKVADTRTVIAAGAWSNGGTNPAEIDFSALSTADLYEDRIYLEVKVNQKTPGIYEVRFNVPAGTGSLVYPAQTADADATALYAVPDVEGTTTRILRQNGAVVVTGLELNPVSDYPGNDATAMARHAYWEKVQEKVRVICGANYSVDAPDAPVNVTLAGSEGFYLADWDDVTGAFDYVVQAEYSADGVTWRTLGDPMTTNYSELRFDPYALTTETLTGGFIRVKVAARNADTPPLSSAETTSTPDTPLRKALPTPELYLELVANGTGFTYAIRMDNLSDYQAIIDAGNAAKVNVSVDVAGSAKTVTLDKIVSGTANYGDLNGTFGQAIVISWQATPTGTLADEYNASASTGGQTQRYGVSQLQSGGVISNWNLSDANINGHTVGFTGELQSQLSYVFSVSHRAGQAYRRTEFVVTDEITDGVTAEVVLVSDVTRISATHIITLAGLSSVAPGQAYTVRSYPWYTQSALERYFHPVATGKTGAEVAAMPEVFTGTALNPGYVLERQSDGTYNVYFSILLATNKFDAQKLAYNGTVPAAHAGLALAATYDGSDPDAYVFSWTDSSAGLYDLVVTGTTADDVEVQAEDRQNMQGEAAGGSVTLDTTAWQYYKVRLELSRHNDLTNGFVTALGTTDTKEYDVPLRLPAPEWSDTPAELVSRDELNYIITWEKPAGAKAQADTAGYTLLLTDGTTQQAYPLDGVATTHTTVDLSAFEGKTIAVTVAARCKTPGALYSADSAENTPFSLNVPSRMVIADPSLTLSPQYTDANPAIPASAFQTPGFTLTMTATTSTPPQIGQYRLEVYVSDTQAAEPPDGSKKITDNATMTAVHDDDPLAAATYTTALKVDYAGEYLYARVRAVSENEISSLWTGWYVFHLPHARLNTPAVTRSSSPMTLNFPLPTGGTESVDVTPVQLNLPRIGTGVAGFAIGMLKAADGATEQMYELRKSSSRDSGFLVKGPDGAEIDPILTESSTTVDDTETTVAYYDYWMPSHSSTVHIRHNDFESDATVCAVLRATVTTTRVVETGEILSQERSVTLHLPEFSSVVLQPGDANIVTGEVKTTQRATVRALAATDKYIDSLRIAWQRGSGEPTIGEIPDD